MTESEQAELQRYREVQLHDLMSRISEDTSCAGWHVGIEQVLFRMTFENAERGFCAGTVDELDIMQLHRLATEADCWWHWPEDVDDVQKITLSEARRLYATPPLHVRRWAVVAIDGELYIFHSEYAGDDALACGSLPAMEAALRLLGGGE